jgi:hypothetical protein
MNWDFFDIVTRAIDNGYKSKWAVHRATENEIFLTIDDLLELAEMYNHKKIWAYHTALEFNIPIKRVSRYEIRNYKQRQQRQLRNY